MGIRRILFISATLIVVLLFSSSCSNGQPALGGKTPAQQSNKQNANQTAAPPPVSPVSKPPATALVKAVDVTDTVIEDWRPTTVLVATGGVVTWLNEGNLNHYIISDEGLFNQTLSPGQSFNYTFSHSGNYTFHDDPYNALCTVLVR